MTILWLVPLPCGAVLWAAPPVWGSQQPLLGAIPLAVPRDGGFPGGSQVIPKCWSVSVTLRRAGTDGMPKLRWPAKVWGHQECESHSAVPQELWVVPGLHNCWAKSNLQLHGQSRDHWLAWCKSSSLSWNQYSAGISCAVIGSLAIFGALLRAPSPASCGSIKISAFLSKRLCTCREEIDNVTKELREDLNIWRQMEKKII